MSQMKRKVTEASSRSVRFGLAIAVSLVLLGSARLSPAAASAARTGVKSEVSEAVKKFEGTWKTAENEGIDAKWTFDGNMLKATVNGVDYTCKVSVDADAKPYSTMDLAIDEGPEDAKGKTSKAIYKFDGEKLTLCVSVPGKDRPKDFMQVEDEAYLFELKKQKKE
jgi:uncharacterized protein (TIGR03067 family)